MHGREESQCMTADQIDEQNNGKNLRELYCLSLSYVISNSLLVFNEQSVLQCRMHEWNTPCV